MTPRDPSTRARVREAVLADPTWRSVGRLSWWSQTARYLRTVRHLRWRQIAYQVLHRLRARRVYRVGGSRPGSGRERYRHAAVGTPAPTLRWQEGAVFPAPAMNSANSRASVVAGLLTFQNRREAVGFPPDWNRRDLPLLWRYHLHYHEFLWVLPFERARDVATDWIERHPCGPDQVGWLPYPTSLRITAWCTCFFGRHRARTLADDAFRTRLWWSIHAQTEHLGRNLEWHRLGNHLLENAVALALAGSCFDHAAARRWFRRANALLARELPEQVLADGGHVERSPMYQCRVLHTLLVLRAAGDSYLRAMVEPYLNRVARALAALTHPDGGIALLNDSALGVHPSPGRLASEAGSTPPSPGGFALAESGYYGARTHDGHYVVCDAGPVGPDYQPAHAHADLFSFELSLRGARVVVDSGVFTYETGPMREYCRSTRAHNTVEIEGRDQVEVWRAFRVGRRCRPRDVVWKPRDGAFELSARHDGYRVLPGRPVHARTFRWRDAGVLDIDDLVDAARVVRSVARLHFHPDCRMNPPDGRACTLDFPGGQARVTWSGWETAAQHDSLYCPEFGIARRNPCLALAAVTARLRGAIRIELA